jgi:hypothetical protein
VPLDYYSDRVRGPRTPAHEEITAPVWGGVVALVERGLALAWFGNDFPLICEDGGAVCGCDLHAFGLAVAAEIPDLGWPLDARRLPPTLAALDLLELVYRNASSPRERSHHGFYEHSHFTFDAPEGRREIRDQINLLLARGGMTYELDEEGQIRHLASPAIEEQLRRDLPPTIDQRFDDLVQTAIENFRDPDPRVRRNALVPLWGAFERAKTILDRDKRKGSKALLRAATAGADPSEVALLEAEMRDLTKVGNSFEIRHHETTVAEVGDELSEQLFARMYAFLYRVHIGLRES